MNRAILIRSLGVVTTNCEEIPHAASLTIQFSRQLYSTCSIHSPQWYPNTKRFSGST